MKRVVAIGGLVQVKRQLAPVFEYGQVDEKRRLVELVYPADPDPEREHARSQILLHVEDAASFVPGSIWRMELRAARDLKPGESLHTYETVEEPEMTPDQGGARG